MSFHRNPFVYVTISLIGGILLWDEFGLSFILLFSLLLVGVSLVLIRKTWGITIAICALFLFLGVLLMENRISNENFDGEYSVVLDIQELKKSDRDWDQGVAKLIAYNENDTVVEGHDKILFYTNSELLESGMRVVSLIDINAIKNTNNPGSFDAETYWKAKGIRHITFVTNDDFQVLSRSEPGVLTRFSEKVRSYVSNALESSLSSDQAGVLKALLLGDKGDLSTSIRDRFANAGAMHLLAVSGLHVGIIAFLLLFFFQKFPRFISNLWAHLLVVIVLWCYALITGLSPSVTRAVLMFSLLILSRLARGQYNPINVLFFAAFIVILWEPRVILDIGFQLSYLAVLGIFLFYEKLEKSLYIRNKVLKWLWQGTSVGLAAQVTTAPLALYYFHQFPNYFALSNIGVMLLASTLMFVSIVLLITFELSFLGALVAYLLSLLVSVLIYFVTWVDELPWSVAKGFELNLFQVILYGAGITLLLMNLKRIHFKFIGAVLLLIFIGSIQFDRFQNLTADHLVILNSRNPIILLHSGKKTICVSTQPELSKGDKMAIKDYLKIYPSRLMYEVLSPSEVLKIDTKEEQWRLMLSQHGVNLESGSDKLELITRANLSSSANSIKIRMPYLPKGDDYSLNSGAFLLRR